MASFKFVSIEKFIDSYRDDKGKKLDNTGTNYKSRLDKFESFLKYKGELANGNYKDEIYDFSPEFLERLKTEFHGSGDIDFYDLMNQFYDYLSIQKLFPNLKDFKSKTAHIYTVVKLLTRNKIAIPKGMLDENLETNDKAIESDNKDGIEKDMIIKILNAVSSDRFKLYLTFLAGSGWRAIEPLYLTWKDFHYVFDDHPNPQYRAKEGKQPKVFLKGEYTKTHSDRYRYITKEVADMLRVWRIKRYGGKRTTIKGENGKRIHVTTNPIEFSWDHHVFSAKTNSTADSNYMDFWYKFDKIRKDLKLDFLDAKGKRKEYNLKSLREYGRTQAYNATSDKEFAEYHFGHKIKYKNKGAEIELQQFKECELKKFTFLDPSVMNDLIGNESKNRLEMEAKLTKKLEQSNQIVAKLAYNNWINDYKAQIFQKIKKEVQRELDRKANPDNYYMGGREIIIDIDEQIEQFPKWFKDNYDIDLTKEQIEKLQIKDVTLTVPMITEYKDGGIIIEPDSPFYNEFIRS